MADQVLWATPGHVFPTLTILKVLYFFFFFNLVPNIIISRHLLLTSCHFLTVPLVALHWGKPDLCLYVSN